MARAAERLTYTSFQVEKREPGRFERLRPVPVGYGGVKMMVFSDPFFGRPFQLGFRGKTGRRWSVFRVPKNLALMPES
jgi:hypothetical protein